jgi:NADP-dependent 3-hydroxy acid dehydrogenase YdfG
MNFHDRRVWITGASYGIGEALALAFHQAGAKLILSARREDELKRVQTAFGREPSKHILPMDVTDAAELPQKTNWRLACSAASIFWSVMPALPSDRARERPTKVFIGG